MQTHIHSSRDDQDPAVGIITIDRRERHNSLDVETARDLRKAAIGLARDDAVRVVTLRGTGGVFCSGADLKYIRDGGDAADLGYLQPRTREQPPGHGKVFKQILEYLHSTISEIRRASKPFVAAVDGVAAAGGLGLAISCDLVVASERSSFEYAYFKTGLCGAESSTFFLPKLMGLGRAFDFALLGARVDARRAQELGLVSAVFADEAFGAESIDLCRRLASGPTRAHAAAKRLMNEAAGVERLDYHLDREIVELVRSADSQDFEQGIAAFFERRTPRFSGR
jgi:2-(1,2-epoxy-1,2-dihydrophenyl)acetyl-CoA isomerase